jgi:predicted phage tail protein
MKRTLQDWANLAEIIGNAAIIISLVFVGLQISDNTREMRSAAAHNATVALQAWYVEVGTNEQAAQVFRKGMSDPTTLSKDEALQFLMNVHSALIAYQSVYFLGTEGTLDASLNQAMFATMGASVTTPGFKWYWRQRSNAFTPEFQDFVEQIIESDPEGGSEIYR